MQSFAELLELSFNPMERVRNALQLYLFLYYDEMSGTNESTQNKIKTGNIYKQSKKEN